MKSKVILASAALLGLTQLALAHPGHGAEGSLAAGALHPLTGIDHVLAMLAVGLCASQLGRRALWILPAAFVTAMLAAALLTTHSLPMVEQAVALSVLALGLMAIGGTKMRLTLATTLVTLFGAFHGMAHGAELGAAASTCVGFGMTSLALMTTGAALGLIGRSRLAIRHPIAGAI